MMRNGPGSIITLPADDGFCVVHRVDWRQDSSRASLVLDTSELLPKRGPSWSPHLLLDSTAISSLRGVSSHAPQDDEACHLLALPGRTSPATPGRRSEGWNWTGNIAAFAAVLSLELALGAPWIRAVAEDAGSGTGPDLSGTGSPSGPGPAPAVGPDVSSFDGGAASGAAESQAAPAIPLQRTSFAAGDLAGDRSAQGAADGRPIEDTSDSDWDMALRALLEPLDDPDSAEPGSATADGPGARTGLVLVGTDGNDVLEGGAGHDYLFGGAGDDRLVGGAGDDVLAGGRGADLMAGGTGDDIYVVDDAGDAIEEGEDAGNDTIVLLQQTEHGLDLGAFGNIENVVAIGDKVVVAGNDLGNIIVARAEQSSLSGGAGADVLIAALGNDRLDGGSDADTMAGRGGNDVYIVDDAGDCIVELIQEGADTVLTTLAEYQLQAFVENLVFAGEGSFRGYGNDWDNALVGGDWDDWIWGDGPWAGDYDSNAPAAPAADEAAQQADQIDAAATLIEAEQLATDALAAILGGPQDVLVLSPPPAPAATDTIVIGSRSNDLLLGHHYGNDTIDAGKGNDTIDGGGGDDTLTGGLGHDTFVFRPGFGSDTITDFTVAGSDSDLILLSRDFFAGYDELEASLQQVGEDVVIAISPYEQITLQNVDKLHLSATDHFDFI